VAIVIYNKVAAVTDVAFGREVPLPKVGHAAESRCSTDTAGSGATMATFGQE
jgi:hypothetical protein